MGPGDERRFVRLVYQVHREVAVNGESRFRMGRGVARAFTRQQMGWPQPESEYPVTIIGPGGRVTIELDASMPDDGWAEV